MATDNFNRLTAAETEALSTLAEEAGELVQACMKVLRHGKVATCDDHDGIGITTYDNISEVRKEFVDVQVAFKVCHFNGVFVGEFTGMTMDELQRAKLLNMENYVHHVKLPPVS